MMTIRRLSSCLAVLILAGLAFQPIARTEESIIVGNQAKIESRELIRQALTKKINWDMTERPLGDFAEDLKKELNIPVRLDSRLLNDLGITPDTTITFKMSGITAKSALSLLLSDLGLTTLIRDEVLLITTPEEAENTLELVVYNVSDLPAFRLPGDKTVPDFEQLIDVIAKNIKPATWDDVGGPGCIKEYNAGDVQTLVVSQTDEVQERISDLLSSMRKLRHWPLSKEEIDKLPPVPPPKPSKPIGGVMSGMGGMGGGMMGGAGGGMKGSGK
jgi:hypothetical protein